MITNLWERYVAWRRESKRKDQEQYANLSAAERRSVRVKGDDRTPWDAAGGGGGGP